MRKSIVQYCTLRQIAAEMITTLTFCRFDLQRSTTLRAMNIKITKSQVSLLARLPGIVVFFL